MFERKTRQIHVGDVAVGPRARLGAVNTTTKAADFKGTLAQIYALSAASADTVRCTWAYDRRRRCGLSPTMRSSDPSRLTQRAV